MGKGYTVRIPGTLAGKLGLREGDRVVIALEGDKIVIRKRPSIYEIASKIPKKIRISPDEVEEASMEEQERLLGIAEEGARGGSGDR